MHTLFKIAQLKPYSLYSSIETIDQDVKEFLERFRPDILDYIKDFSRATFDPDIHIKNLHYFNRSIADEHTYAHRIRQSPLMQKARLLAEQALAPAFRTKAISAHNFDAVPYVKSSSAGYGYQGSKRDNYLLARG